MVFTACGAGIVAPASTAQQSSAPTIVSVIPDSGPPAGGKTVTINGSNFTSGTNQTPPSVSFGGVPATHITVVSPTQVSAMIPAHVAGTVSVKVTNSNAESFTLSGAFTYTTTSTTISSVSPISGPAAGGTKITISGTNFQSGVGVSFGGFPASSITVSNSTTIQALTPAHSSGLVSITVTNPDGQSAALSSAFTFHSIDLFWSAPASTPVTVAGYNVYRAMSSAGPFGKLNGSTTVANTSFSDVTTQGSTTYYYEVKSVDTMGTESAPAGPIQATTTQ